LQGSAFRRCFAGVHAANRRRRGRLWAQVAAALVILALLAVVAARALLPSWLVRQAAARGVVLQPSAVEAHLGRMVVRDATVRLAAVRGLEAHVATLTIELDVLTLRRALLDGISVDMHGGEPLQDVPLWFAAHPIAEGAGPRRVASRATGARVRW